MAKRIFFAGAQTFTAQVYSSALTGSTYMALAGGTSTQLLDVLEIKVTGMATASTVAAIQLTRTSGTVFATNTALASPNSDGPAHPATAALSSVPLSFVAATTNPSPSAVTTDAKIDCGLNLFGGLYRSNFAPTQQWSILGNAVGLGNSVLFNSSTSGGSSGLANAHIMYEPY